MILNAIGVAIAVFVGAFAAIAMGRAISQAADAVARQPEASDKINQMLIVGLAFIETTAIYGFVIAILMMGTVK
jgi:F-type H+-transporting ATPase subunit c